MADEKMVILNMLQEGKITAEQAAKLLATVDNPEPPRPQSRTTAERPGPSEELISNDGTRGSYSAPRSSSSFDDLGKRFENLAQEWQPRLQRVAETVAEKAVGITDRISRTISESNPEGRTAVQREAREPRTPKPSAPPMAKSSAPASVPGGGIEKNIELNVISGYNELSLSGLNGDVRIKGYNGDKITARVRYVPLRGGASVEMMKLGGKYYLNYEEDDFKSLSIDAYVPDHLFKVINISGIGGNMDLSALECEQMQISNANGQTTLSGLTAEKIKCETSNGRLTLSYITAQTAVFEHFNGVVEAFEIDASQLSLTNFNGVLTFNVTEFKKYTDYLWKVETSNAKLTMNVPTLPNLGYHIKAYTALNDVRLGLTGLEYSNNSPGNAEARTAGFERCRIKVRMALETSNAPLLVN